MRVFWHRHRYAVVWGATALLAVLDIVFTVALTRIKVHIGEPLVTADEAVIIGIQTFATILLAGLTATYVLITRDLLTETVAQRERADRLAADAERRARASDLDETRRLAYMALLRNLGEPELAASLLNALVHHQGVALDTALKEIPDLFRRGDDRWIRAQIDRISDEWARLR